MFVLSFHTSFTHLQVKIMGQVTVNNQPVNVYAVIDGHHRLRALRLAIKNGVFAADYAVNCNVYKYEIPKSLAFAHAGSLNEANDDYGTTTFVDRMAWITNTFNCIVEEGTFKLNSSGYCTVEELGLVNPVKARTGH